MWSKLIKVSKRVSNNIVATKMAFTGHLGRASLYDQCKQQKKQKAYVTFSRQNKKLDTSTHELQVVPVAELPISIISW